MANKKSSSTKAEKKAKANKLERQKKNYNDQKKAENRKIAANNEKIRRLKVAKNTLQSKKNEFKTIKNSDNNAIKYKRTWKGSNYNKFKEKGSDLNDENTLYYKSIDRTLDSINNEICKYENENLKSKGVIGWIESKINTLSHQINNLLN